MQQDVVHVHKKFHLDGTAFVSIHSHTYTWKHMQQTQHTQSQKDQ